MKRFVLLLSLCSAFAVPLAAQHTLPESFRSRWWLAVLEEASLPINLTFSDQRDGLQPLLYSPMQTSDSIPPTSWSFSNDTLRLTHKPTGLRLVLCWNVADTTFTGTFRQGLLHAQMRFLPVDGLFSPSRPQTPLPPFPYRDEEVTVTSKNRTVTLTGTLTLPQGDGPFPAVVLVSGSGQQNRDEELMGHKPFLVLADYLTRQGIAVLRYDDRGVGGSKGEVEQATTFDFADDAEMMFDFLRKHKSIDRRRVGILGHSEGGIIAPIVASRNRRVAFVVTLGGPGTTGAEVLLQQNGRIMELAGVPDRLNERHGAMLRDFFAMVDTLPASRYQERLIALCDEKSSGLTTDERKQASLRKADAMAMALQMQMPWMRTFLTLDNSDYLRKVRCPLLALNGDRDCQVLPCNLDAIGRATEGRAELRLMKGLNHLMQHCETGAPGEYMLIEETMAPEVMETVAKWILKVGK